MSWHQVRISRDVSCALGSVATGEALEATFTLCCPDSRLPVFCLLQLDVWSDTSRPRCGAVNEFSRSTRANSECPFLCMPSPSLMSVARRRRQLSVCHHLALKLFFCWYHCAHGSDYLSLQLSTQTLRLCTTFYTHKLEYIQLRVFRSAVKRTPVPWPDAAASCPFLLTVPPATESRGGGCVALVGAP